MSDDAPRWLDPDGAARYLSVRPAALGRLVKQGRIPKPSYALGPRSPRWHRLALDGAFEGGAASTNPIVAAQIGAPEIIEEARAR